MVILYQSPSWSSRMWEELEVDTVLHPNPNLMSLIRRRALLIRCDDDDDEHHPSMSIRVHHLLFIPLIRPVTLFIASSLFNPPCPSIPILTHSHPPPLLCLLPSSRTFILLLPFLIILLQHHLFSSSLIPYPSILSSFSTFHLFLPLSSSLLMFLLFLLPLLFHSSPTLAQSCNSKELLGTYLKCLKGELDRDYPTFEQELKEHTRRAAGTCFAQNIGDANRNERCVLAVTDLDAKAWDRNGPLRDCSICRTFATGAIKAILSTPAEEQKCIREQISKAIAGEAETCLKKKVADFSGVPEIPDLEEGAFAIREQVIDSISDYIWIHSRLAFCAERKPERAAATQQCLKSPFLGFYQKHCQVLNSCDTAAAGSQCLGQLRGTKTSTCECIDEARDDLKRRIAGIADAIQEAVQGSSRAAPSIGSNSKVDQCVANIKRQLVTPTNDWAATIDNALNSCIKNKPSSQSLGIDSLLNVGCRKIIADSTGTAQAQIKTGFEFVNNLIDAMVERSRRFCGGAHCEGGN